MQLIEAVAENDDEMMHMYLEGQEPTVEQLKAGIRKATIAMKIFPVLCGSSFKNKGVQTLLDAVVDYLPSPLDIPPMVGINPDNMEEKIIRKADDNEPFCRAWLQDYDRPVRRPADLHPRLLGSAQDRRFGSESAYRQDGAHWPPAEDACQQARRDYRDSRRRYLRGGRA